MEKLVAAIHQSPQKVVICVAGGGTGAIARLLEVPGASRTVLETVIPYAPEAMSDWLGGPPDQACAAQTARSMAMASFLRACRFCPTDSSVAGVACTASLATDRPKKGGHRIHLAIQAETLTATRSLELQKGHRSRAEEERLATTMILNALAETCGLDQRLPLDLAEAEQIDGSNVAAPKPWQDLLMGRIEAACQGGSASDTAAAVFPGAFNPLHFGHRRMAELAREMLGVSVHFELSILNVDKPPLDYFQIQRRSGQFAPSQRVWLTRLATFDEKSRRFPGATFVVGSDTLSRIADPRYYGNDPEACQKAIATIGERGCRFLVFARREKAGLRHLAELGLPNTLETLCREVPPDVFCEDVCSSDLRNLDGC